MPKISEIFHSFQGEGLRLGFPSIFIRFTGCAVQCPYCDSKDSWGKGTAMTEKDILTDVEKYKKKYPHSQVVLTGGEPLEQDLPGIVDELKKKDFFLSIETNGTQYRDLAIDWWTVSPKDVTGFYIHKDLLEKISEIKLVVNQNLTIAVIEKIREKVKDVPVFLQPQGYDKNRYQDTFLLFQRCQEAGLDNIRAGIQLHKVYKVR